MSDTEMIDVSYTPSFEPHDLSKLNHHITLPDFAKSVQKAVNASFPNDQQLKYVRVYALLLLWEDEDPKLPVSKEVKDLNKVLASGYNFEVEIY
ncbi:hypothetical protein SBOR_3428 [Sclerotinia borealis F-4128]|uniref:Uncharacterized protein n=1 Tax=Sclerotinia borealis (strain F-4128) TaxID=1432307 RepID=W9CJG4_SCLBF|nr:hypothetical protein SBOR_3428 [Sclerotinia borealis F-4128]